jgi:glucosamine--fructose-6-phosphate aminotransferase (isomerizing)
MCGICAGVGERDQLQNVIEGLKKLEYRGYDSSGVAVVKHGKIEVCKSVGQIKFLQEKLQNFGQFNLVIGHTRWATHGRVCEENSHPHISADGSVALVHNGIIENFEQIKTTLAGVKYYSQTDSEVFVNLIAKQSGTPLQKLIAAAKVAQGSFAIAAIFVGEKKIFCAKRKSPLYVGFGYGQTVAASDVSALENTCKSFYILYDDEFAVLSKNAVEIYDINGDKIQKEPKNIEKTQFFDDFSDEKCYMRKEIAEEPVVLKRTFFKYFSENTLSNETLSALKKFKNFHFIACGTAYHACLLGAEYLRKFTKITCTLSVASEFRYGNEKIRKNCLYVFVSQSGETADTIACANMVKNFGAKILCITNVPYCTLNNLADFILPTFAGKEIAVASTKAYAAQVLSLLILAMKIGGVEEVEDVRKFVLGVKISPISDEVFREIFKFKKIFFVGRGQDYVTSLEGALKLKEIAYINCVAIPAGELKHGTLALVDESTLVIVCSTRKDIKEKTESSIQEIKARGGKILLLSQFSHKVDVDFEIKLSDFAEPLMPIENIFFLQQLALAFCEAEGFDPDKPRNLAKSVTVE